MLLEASKQRIIELFQIAGINVTDVLHTQWIDDKREEVEVKYRPKALARWLKLKPPAPRMKIFTRQAYEIALEIDGIYRLYLKADDLKALRIKYNIKPGLFFETLVPVLERGDEIRQMEIVWAELIKRVGYMAQEIEQAKKNFPHYPPS